MSEASVSLAALGVRYGTLTIRVESDDTSHLEWLREFLTPSFVAVDACPSASTVRLVTDPAGYAEALERGADPGGEDAPCFWQDSGVARLPRWATRGGSRAFLDRQCHALLRSDAGGTIEILTSGHGRAIRYALMRVVRELAMLEARRQGGLVLHAAALTVRGRVILIAGPKGAGKTSLLVHLLRASATQFVANDRAVIPTIGRNPAVRGIPTIVKLVRESAERFPDLQDLLTQSTFHHQLTLAEDRAGGRRAAGPKAVWSLSPAQFCALVRTDPVAGGPLGAVVFPRLSDAPGRIAWRRLPVAESAAALAAAQLGSLRGVPPEASVPAWMPEVEPPNATVRDTGTDEERCARLARRVPAFEIRLGPDAYSDVSSASRLLAAVSV